MKNSFFVFAFFFAACDLPDPGADGTSARFYAGPGSQWTAQLNLDQSFTVLHFPAVGDITADQLINGDVGASDNAFVPLAVTSSAGTGQPAEGATGYGLQIPGSFFVLSPFGGTGPLIPMAAMGQCATSAIAENMVKVKVASNWSPAVAASATFTFDPASGIATMPAQYTLAAPTISTVGLQSMGAGSCADGLAQVSNGAEVYLTQTGVAVVHTQPQAEANGQDEIYFALPQTSDSVTPTAVAGDYVGVMVVGGTNVPVSLSLTANGTSAVGAAKQVNVVSGALGSVSAQISLDGAGSSNGFVTGTIDTSGPNGGGTPMALTCASQLKSGGDMPTRAILSCAGTDQAAQFVSLLLVSN